MNDAEAITLFLDDCEKVRLNGRELGAFIEDDLIDICRELLSCAQSYASDPHVYSLAKSYLARISKGLTA